MIRVYLSGDPVHDRVLEAFYEGIQEEKDLIEGFKYEPSDAAVIFGVYKSKIRKSWPRGKVFRQQRENNLDVVVLETGYINRGDGENHHYAAGLNGLNGRADFRNKNMGPERWESLGVQLKPYSRGEKVILCAQVPWDASVDNHDHKAWVIETAQQIREVTTRPIVFRPHPRANLPPIKGCEYSVRPLIDGKPVIAFDEGSMAWELANKKLENIEDLEYPHRQQWARNIAYCQWKIEEMANGDAWRHLFR
jgi:hypothetical protein